MATATKALFKPLGNRVVILPSEGDEQVSAGGIYIPDTAKEKPMEGEVISTGPGRVLDNGERQEIEIKTGQTVLFAKYAGTEVKYNDTEYLIISEKDVLAVIKN